MVKTFSFGDMEYPHEVGNAECPECWGSFPVKCEDCGGNLHAQFYEEDWDNVYLFYHCDQCENTDAPL